MPINKILCYKIKRMIYSKYLISISFLFASHTLYSQSPKTFTLTDSVFEVGSVFKAKHIYWPLGKWTFREESYPMLDSLIVFLKNNPTIEIEVIRSEIYDPQRSSYHAQLRADEIINYLVTNGIEKKRLTATGKFEIREKQATQEDFDTGKIGTVIVIKSIE